MKNPFSLDNIANVNATKSYLLRTCHVGSISPLVALAFAVFLAVTPATAQAQTAGYFFSSRQGTFTPLTDATAVTNIESDDALSLSLPVGFDFTFYGTTYSTLKASSNGFLTFNPAHTSSPYRNDISGTLLTHAIMPFWDDLNGSGGAQASYKVTGSSPNRVYTFEWLNFESVNDNGEISCQVSLHETSNVIELVYGPSVLGSSSASIGIKGVATDFFSLAGSGTSPMRSSDGTDDISTRPSNGQVYQFALTPPSSMTNDDFVLKITTTAGTNPHDSSFTFYSQDTVYMVDWGEGSGFEQITTGNAPHTFNTAGEHTIRFRNLNDVYINQQADATKYTSIEQWGTALWNADMMNAFDGASNLTMSSNAGIPDMRIVTNMWAMFAGATSFNGDIGGWNTASVTNMSAMFNGADSFNGDISGWNTAQVTTMAWMFREATSFDQNIGGWNTAKVTNMWAMFWRATSFDQNIGGWNVEAVEFMDNMFWGADSFNGDISGWNTAQVTNMVGMFEGATSFDQNIGGWNTAKVTDMGGMFSGATTFDQNIGGWNTAQVTNMRSMFSGATTFNQDISGWNTAQVPDMVGMFSGATSFDQNIGGWNTAQVTDMYGMFSGAISFDQNIGGWNVEAVQQPSRYSGMNDMFAGVTLSIANYDSLLVGWNRQTLQTGVTFHGGNSLYMSTQAQTARANMISATGHGWTITDRGLRTMNQAPTNISLSSTLIAENESANAVVGMLSNTDTGGTYAYTLVDGDGDADNGSFNILGTTLRLTASADYETKATYSVRINVHDGTHDFAKQLTIYVGDGNDAPTARDATYATFVVVETSASGTAVGAVPGTDPDQDSPNNALTYAITGGNTGNVFAINPTTGVITVAGALDYATTPSYSLMVTVADGGSPSLSGTGMLTITVREAKAVTPADDFVLKITTNAPDRHGRTNPSDRSFTFYTQDTNYDIDWNNDGVFEATGVSGDQSHTFPTAGTHTIRFRNLNDININSQAGKEKYTSIEQWGTAIWNPDMSSAFRGASNLIMKPTAGTPDMLIVTNMSAMFSVATVFNQDIGNWNTASVTNMRSMFAGATAFNGDIGDWNTAQVTDMGVMFYEATSFNGDISGWNVASVTEMSDMFNGATAFNGDIDGWNTASVTSMFNMFFNATSFDQNIGGWNVEAVEFMDNMFREASSFNGDIGRWNTAKVRYMGGMFYGARSFIQDIGGWNTASVTGMGSMFREASSFNQDIGGWNVEAVRDASDMFSGVTLSITNYDSLLVGWNRQTLQTGVTFDGGGSKYSSNVAHTARENMVATTANGGDNWDITDGGRVQAGDAPTALFLSPTSIAENAGANAVVGTLSTNGGASSYTYALVAGTGDTDNSSFRISGTALQLIASADYETKTSYAVRLKVDGVMPEVAKQFTITVTDVNEAPVFANGATATVSYAENGTTPVTTVDATDADAGQTVTLTLSGDDAGLFSITPAGVLTFNTAPDYEMPTDAGGNNEYEVTVTATDDGTPEKMATQALTITVTGPPDDFVLKVTTTSAPRGSTNPTDRSFTFYSQDMNYMVDWGEGSGFEQVTTGDAPHTFNTAGEHTIRFRNLTDIHINSSNTFSNPKAAAAKYTSIEQWGTSVWNVAMDSAFRGASNLTMNASAGTPKMGMVTSMVGMFQYASSFNGDISGWNVASVTNMAYMFQDASSFNGDISGWNVASVTNMQRMFSFTNFNGDIGGWNVASVTNMQRMFGGTTFNQDISGWNVASVENMFGMFSDSNFNQDIGEWNTASVTNMSGMFWPAHAFNQDIGNWNTASVTNMNSMFREISSFNQDLGGWNVEAVTTMEDMFESTYSLSPTNYDSLLVGWNRQNLQSGVSFHGGGSKYSSDAAHTARENMKATTANSGDNWTITDGGRVQAGAVPTALFLSSTSIAENAGANAVVGTLSTNGGASSYTYTLVAGTGDTDNSRFNISGTSLRLTASADYETQATYAVRLKVDGVAVAKQFTITVTDVEIETTAPVFANGATATVSYAENGTTPVTTVDATDADAGQTVTLTLSGDDAALFTITPAGELTFNTSPDYELPGSASGSNTYSVTVTATDNGTPAMTATQALTITVTDEDELTPSDDFVLKITTTAGTNPNDSSFTFYSQDTVYMVDWGEGSGFEQVTTGNAPHTFNTAGEHTIRFRNLNDIHINRQAGEAKYTSIEQWGTAVWNAEMDSAFRGAGNLTMTAIDTPDLSFVTNMAYMFADASSFNGDISGWNVASVRDASDMFSGVTLSIANYDSLLVGWNRQTLQTGVTFHGGDSKYHSEAAHDARTNMISATGHNWTMTDGGRANVHAPVFANGATATVSYAENGTTPVTTVDATDADAGQTVTFFPTLLGADASLFSITPAGELTFNTAPDFEMPTDVGTNNMYEVTVTATDNGTPAMTATQALTITVTDEDEHAPVFTSSATHAVSEGMTVVTTVTATDADADQTVSFTLTGGADESLFSITSAGDLTFTTAPDYEMPTDAGGNNEYDVTITATDDGTPEMTATQALTITVTDVDENNIHAPVFANGATASVSYAENGTTPVTPTVDATDADQGQTVTFTLSGADAGLFSLTPTGVLTFRTAPDYESPVDTGMDNMYEVTITATDGQTPPKTATQALTITVTDVANELVPVDPAHFVLKITTTAADESFTFYTEDTSYDIDWDDDGVFEDAGISENQSHTFAVSGDHTIRFRDLNDININDQPDEAKYTSIAQWGTAAWDSDMSSAFRGAINLTMTATDTPDMRSVTNMTSMFAGAGSFDGDISGWDVSSVTNMRAMFNGASSFNGEIDGWNVSSVTTMAYMFAGSSSFDQTLVGWNTASVTDMAYMFRGASSFNSEVGGWNVSSVTNMRAMFSRAATFNQEVVGWNVSSVTDMSVMFWNAGFFNQALGGWDVSSVRDMNGMFQNAATFDQDLGGWNTAQVTSMERMFWGTSTFNQDLGRWTVSSVTDMSYMFYVASSFNGAIGGWDVSSVTDMSYMFQGAGTFDQDLGGWDVSSVRYMERMFSGVTLSSSNYDLLLAGWNGQQLTPGVTFDGGNSLYRSTEAQTAKDEMIRSDGWSITDGGRGTMNQAPTNIFLSSTRIAENAGANAEVGMLSNTDRGGTYVYTLVPGDGDGDNGSFTTLGTALRLTSSADYESRKATYSVRINVSDGSHDFAKHFTISVDDENEAPTARDAAFSVSEISTVGTPVGTVTATDPDHAWPNNVLTYAITGGNTGNVFAINPTTGAVTVAGALDYSTTASYALEVTVTDGGGTSRLSGTATLIITGTHVESGGTNQTDHFVLTITTTSADELFTFYTEDTRYDIDWNNDQMFEAGDTEVSGTQFHTFAEAGAHAIRFRNLNDVYINKQADAAKYTVIEQWGTAVWNADMSHAFHGAINLTMNERAGIPNMGTVTNMSYMFAGATSFDQNIAGWNTSTVTDMTSMFQNAASFNRAIDGWDVSSVTNMTSMFFRASAFNQDLDGWNVASVTNMTSMFDGANSFNGDISGWNTALVTDMTSMFAFTTSFNGAIGGWNVGTVTSMWNMFAGATAFDQDIGGWNTASVTDMYGMFLGASSFDQDLGGWNVAAVRYMESMFSGVTLSLAHYDSLLVGWNRQELTPGVTFDGGTSLYISDEAQTARANMISSAGWTITDGGLGTMNQAPTNIFLSSHSISENVVAFAEVGTLSNTDAGGTYVYTLESGDGDGDNGSFDILGTTLGLTTSADYETQASYLIRINVYDGTNNFAKHFDIAVDQVNEAPTASNATFSVAENSANGTAVGIVVATDPDETSPPDNVLTYAITGGNTGAVFAISPTTGAVTVAGALDFESKSSPSPYSLEVTVSDGGSPSLSSTVTLTITVTDVNDNAPVFTSGANVTVLEGTKEVTTVTARDANVGQTVIMFLPTLTGDDADLFTITPEGVLTFDTEPDYENPKDTGSNNIYEVTVTAIDGQSVPLTATQTFTVTVTDVNEHAPVFTEGGTVVAVTYAENSTTAVTTVGVTDADTEQTVGLALSGGADVLKFSITPAGALTFNRVPDYENPTDTERNNLYKVIVTATDGQDAAQTATQTLNITVTGVNEHAPLFTRVAEVEVPEGSTVAATITAADADAQQPVTFLTTLSGDDADMFSITTTGELTFNTVPDYEHPGSVSGTNVYTVTVTATDGQEPALTAVRTFTITVTDVVSENAPVFTSGSEVNVLENSSIATTVTATDADAGETETLMFTLTGGADARLFTLTPAGELRFKTVPDYEDPADADEDNRYEVIVTVTDGRERTMRTLTITVTNENDNAPVFTRGTAMVEVLEGMLVATTVTATDADAGQTVTFLTTLSGADAGLFSITSSGELTFTTAPDYENPGSASGSNVYTVAVTATDGQVPAQTTLQTFTITVTDVENEHAPVFPEEMTMDIAEGTTVVTTVIATDADAGQTVSFSLTGGADMGLFSITTAGVLTFNTAPKYAQPADADGDNRYEVIVAATDGQPSPLTATQTLTITVTEVLGLESLTEIAVYPNPAGAVLHISGVAGNARYTLSDIDGKVLQRGKLEATGTATHSVALPSLKQGIYLLQLTTGRGSITRKIVKE